MDGKHEAKPFVETPYDDRWGQFSPDSRWVAFQSEKSGQPEVYVRPFPEGDSWEKKVSTQGGFQPRWAADGQELYYLRPDGTLMAVPVSITQAMPEFGKEEPLFSTTLMDRYDQQYDVAPDGRFLMFVQVFPEITNPIKLILNWRPPAD
jgi:Tol biopolymer transport system component